VKTDKRSIVGFCVAWMTSMAPTWADDGIRSINGEGNNLKVPQWGMAGAQLQRFAEAAYEDGMSLMAGEDRPSPRMVSNLVSRHRCSWRVRAV